MTNGRRIRRIYLWMCMWGSSRTTDRAPLDEIVLIALKETSLVIVPIENHRFGECRVEQHEAIRVLSLPEKEDYL